LHWITRGWYWKLTMLLGAGLTIRNAFTRIALEEKRRLEETGAASAGRTDHGGRGQQGRARPGRRRRAENAPDVHYLEQEMLLTVREMRSGVPEAAAYENFGRRCGLQSYIKLGSLLSQNLKKGSRGLTGMLEKEALSSMEEHRALARKVGEKAGLKLMLPMGMMFAVVLAVLVIPILSM